jgi:hypothetical protein
VTDSRSKGKRGERLAAKELSRLFGVECRRGVQYRGGPESPDVCGIQGVHFEVKNTQSFRLWDALSQATDDAAEDTVPAVLHKRNGSPWVLVVELDDLPELVQRLFVILAAKGS